MASGPRYISSVLTLQKTPLLTFLLLLHHVVIGADRVENTDSQLLRCFVLRSCYPATGLLAEPFRSNCCLCCLHSSCLEQICRIALHISVLLLCWLSRSRGRMSASCLCFAPVIYLQRESPEKSGSTSRLSDVTLKKHRVTNKNTPIIIIIIIINCV
jgi:hypothetical protein